VFTGQIATSEQSKFRRSQDADHKNRTPSFHVHSNCLDLLLRCLILPLISRWRLPIAASRPQWAQSDLPLYGGTRANCGLSWIGCALPDSGHANCVGSRTNVASMGTQRLGSLNSRRRQTQQRDGLPSSPREFVSTASPPRAYPADRVVLRGYIRWRRRRLLIVT
jgi:hypothetical protein